MQPPTVPCLDSTGQTKFAGKRVLAHGDGFVLKPFTHGSDSLSASMPAVGAAKKQQFTLHLTSGNASYPASHSHHARFSPAPLAAPTPPPHYGAIPASTAGGASGRLGSLASKADPRELNNADVLQQQQQQQQPQKQPRRQPQLFGGSDNDDEDHKHSEDDNTVFLGSVIDPKAHQQTTGTEQGPAYLPSNTAMLLHTNSSNPDIRTGRGLKRQLSSQTLPTTDSIGATAAYSHLRQAISRGHDVQWLHQHHNQQWQPPSATACAPNAQLHCQPDPTSQQQQF